MLHIEIIIVKKDIMYDSGRKVSMRDLEISVLAIDFHLN